MRKLKLSKSGNIVLTSRFHDREFLIDFRFLPDKLHKPIILFIHGFKGFKDWGAFNLMADYFADEGFFFVKMNFSYNGTTVDQPTDFADLDAFGNNNFSIEQSDITTVLDYLVSELNVMDCDLNNISIIGHSRGGAAAILAAAKDDRIKRLATLAAMNDLSSRYPKEVMDEWKEHKVFHIYNGRTKQQMPLYYQIVEDYLKNVDQLNVKEAIKQINKPFIAIHGSEDETLPVGMLNEMKLWNKKVEIVEIQGVNHTFGSTHPYLKSLLPKDLKIAVDHIITFLRKS